MKFCSRFDSNFAKWQSSWYWLSIGVFSPMFNFRLVFLNLIATSATVLGEIKFIYNVRQMATASYTSSTYGPRRRIRSTDCP